LEITHVTSIIPSSSCKLVIRQYCCTTKMLTEGNIASGSLDKMD